MTRRKKAYILVISDCILLLAAVALKPVAAWMIEYLPNCILWQNGILCPSCGATRCVQALLSFEFISAFQLNPFFFLLAFFLLFIWIVVHIEILFQSPLAERIRKKLVGYKTVILLSVAWVLFGIIRNLI